MRTSASRPVSASFSEALREGIALQSRFVPEPRFKLTGVGFMRSAGVAEIHAAKLKDKAVARAGTTRQNRE